VVGYDIPAIINCTPSDEHVSGRLLVSHINAKGKKSQNLLDACVVIEDEKHLGGRAEVQNGLH
jgi:hypothetical protein